MEENINCLGNKILVHKSAYLSPMGWSGKDSLLLDGGFFFLIDVRLIRDNWKAVIGNYRTSLIGEIWFTSLIDEIWFDLQNKQLLGIILLPLLVRFCLIYRI